MTAALHLLRCSLAAVLVVGSGETQQPVAFSGDAAEVVREVLRGVRGELPQDEATRLRRRLRSLGPDGVPTLLAALDGRLSLATEDEPGATLDARGRELVYETLAAWPEPAVVSRLVAVAHADVSLGERLTVMRVLGRLRTAGAAAALLGAIEAVPPAQARHPLVLDVFSESLRALVGRDDSSFRVIEHALTTVDRGVLPAIVEVLGRTGDWRGLALVEGMLGDDPRLDAAVLASLENLDRWVDPLLTDRLWWVRERLEDADGAVRRQAALTLARLRDVESTPAFLALLTDEDGRARRGAHWALRELTGFRWNEDPERWRRWYDAEQAWLVGEAPKLLARLASAEPARAADALRLLAEHDLHRDALTDEIAELVTDGRPGVALAAVAALVRLGSPRAVEPLLDALADGRDELAAAASRALATLTGRDHGREVGAWRAALGR